MRASRKKALDYSNEVRERNTGIELPQGQTLAQKHKYLLNRAKQAAKNNEWGKVQLLMQRAEEVRRKHAAKAERRYRNALALPNISTESELRTNKQEDDGSAALQAFLDAP